MVAVAVVIYSGFLRVVLDGFVFLLEYQTNWRDDDHKKFADYEEMGIREYWIVDYAALGSKVLIGDPKQPIITIYCLNDEGEYRGKQFRGTDCIVSPTFSYLNLTVEQIFSASY